MVSAAAGMPTCRCVKRDLRAGWVLEEWLGTGTARRTARARVKVGGRGDKSGERQRQRIDYKNMF